MIAVDFNPIAIAGIAVAKSYADKQGEVVSDNLMRHLIFSQLGRINREFRSEYGELVICSDSGSCWRKDIFPQYKENRKVVVSADEEFWNTAHSVMDETRDALIENFPYTFVRVHNAEADDIIAVLAERWHNENRRVMVVSRDKDFMQLHKFSGVKQYDPMSKKIMENPDPVKFLHIHIIKGDASDGIPNCLSADNVIATQGLRQTPLSKRNIAIWSEMDVCDLPDNAKAGYHRNRRLIDFNHIPQEIRDEITTKYEKQDKLKVSGKINNYLMKTRLIKLMENTQDFVKGDVKNDIIHI